jgi:hypothetical protein
VAAWLQGGTSIYVLTTTYLAGLLPAALGDWSNIVGALCYIPMVRAAHATAPRPAMPAAHLHTPGLMP